MILKFAILIRPVVFGKEKLLIHFLWWANAEELIHEILVVVGQNSMILNRTSYGASHQTHDDIFKGSKDQVIQVGATFYKIESSDHLSL